MKAAQAWLRALDDGDETFLWQHASQLTQNKQDKAITLKYWVGGRQGYGKVIQRDLQLNFAVEPYQFRGNIPDGIYRRLVFWTKYEKRDLAREELWLSYEDGEWKILAYGVR